MNNTLTPPEDRVISLPGYESFDTVSIAQRLPKVFRLKSIKQLRMEKDKRNDITVFKNAK